MLSRQHTAEMRYDPLLSLLCVLGLCLNGCTAVIETQQTVMAAVGDEALLSCQLTQAKDVLQVTWQKSEREKNVASYTEQFGERVNVDFRDKVKFKDAGLQNSSIIIRDVTEKDEGCYQCLFNTYPEGAFIDTTCLKVYELHEPVLHVTESNSPEETVVSCLVTGRPAPTVTLRVLEDNVHLSNFSSDSVINANGTVTVITTAVLPCFHDNSTQVVCAVRVPSVPQIERFMMIPEVKQTSADGFDEESESDSGFNSITLSIVLSLIVACGCVAAVILFIRRHKPRYRSSEETDMDETKITMKGGTPLVTQEMQIRKRTPPEQNRTSVNTQMSPSAARRLVL